MDATVIYRARTSLGTSNEAIYRMAARALSKRHVGGGTLLDIGCGSGELRTYVQTFFTEYVGADIVRYEDFPSDTSFLQIDLDAGRVPLPDQIADVVAAVETIEHLENPRAFFRELCRLAKPGGLVLVTTPNQLSFVSKLTLLIKNQFNAFQEGAGLYPAHITALLEVDLIRIAQESGLSETVIEYSDTGRVPFLSISWPHVLGFRGRAFSDNLLIICTKPHSKI